MKYTRLPNFKVQTSINDSTIIIGKDKGMMSNKTYYYIEVNSKVIQHGFKSQKEAKQYVSTQLFKPTIINDEKKLEVIADELGKKAILLGK
jgi:hypothetical protein